MLLPLPHYGRERMHNRLVKASYLWVQVSVTHLQLPLVWESLAIPHS